MNPIFSWLPTCGLSVLIVVTLSVVTPAAEWIVPLGGNAYVTQSPAGAGDGLQRGGTVVRWRNPETVFAVFFHVDRPARVELSLRGVVPGTEMTATVAGHAVPARSAEGGAVAEFGGFDVPGPGYVRVDLSRRGGDTDAVTPAPDLLVRSDTADLAVVAVRSNENRMYYWGRRGPSVHLGYQVPAGTDVTDASCEVTVPEGQDPIGSFFMAIGFGEGYCGIQVNSPTERRVLFSVWSPFSTDNPATIPAGDRVETLASGPGVKVGQFGGEGSGGQSFLVFPWRAGTTYRFLVRATPDGHGSTVYAAWFAPVGTGPDSDWRLIARFRRPRTNKHLTGFHSFLENFADATGHLGRRAVYSNQWIRDVSGRWIPVTAARFTGDATAGGGHRLDYAGGIEGAGFFLRNCGFFAERVPLNQAFQSPREPGDPPRIDAAKLP